MPSLDLRTQHLLHGLWPLATRILSMSISAPAASSKVKYFIVSKIYIYMLTNFSDDVVITAAHCVTNKMFDIETFVVIAGVLDLRFAGAEERRIADTRVHPDYGEPAVYFDVALIILEKV